MMYEKEDLENILGLCQNNEEMLINEIWKSEEKRTVEVEGQF